MAEISIRGVNRFALLWLLLACIGLAQCRSWRPESAVVRQTATVQQVIYHKARTAGARVIITGRVEVVRWDGVALTASAATVRVDNEADYFRLNTDGKYHCMRPPGSHIVTATQVGYLHSRTKPFVTVPGDSVYIRLLLLEDQAPTRN